MSADREQVKANLADLIVSRTVKSDFSPDLSKLDADDVLVGLTGYSNLAAIDARERCTEALIAQAAAWLDSDPRGALLLDEAIEREEDDQRELAEMNAAADVAA